MELSLSVLLFLLSVLPAPAQAPPSASGDVTAAAAGATPFLVQHRTDAHDLAAMAESAIWTNLPNPSVAGNCLIVTVYYSGATPTVNDDKSNSYSRVITSDVVDGQNLSLFIATNVAAGTKKITARFGSTSQWFSLIVGEFAHCAGVRAGTATTNVGAGTTVSAGSITPQSGDLIYQVAANPTFPATSWTEMAGATALSLNNINGLAAQYLVSNGSAVNPGFALSPSGDWVTVAVAIAPSSGGGDIPGMHVFKTDLFYQSNMTRETFKFPVAGNLTVGIWDSDQDISSISSTPAATWLNAVNNSGPNSGYTDIYYARQASPQTYSITLTNPGVVAQGTMLMYDVTGADSHASVELTATYGGYMGSSGNLDVGSITPTSASPGLLFFVTSIEIEGLIGVVSPANGIWDAGGNKQDPPAGHASGYGEDGWGHAPVQCSSLPCSPIDVVWSTTGAVHGWNTSMAVFYADTAVPTNYTLTATKTGNGTGTILSGDGQINCPADCNSAVGSYASGTTVTLAASPDSNSTFAGWSGCDSVAGANCSINVNSNRTATATFSLIPIYTLAVSKAGTGSGTVTSSPAGINCGATCSAAYSSGTAVTLTASADASSTFAGWSGAGCSGTGKCVVTMDAAKSVTATFNLNPTSYSLTVSTTGSGTVTSSDGYINCGTSCTHTYASGSSVTLNATAASGWSFAGWGGACSGAGSCTVTMTSAKTVTASFAQNLYTLTVSKAGTGGGTVTSSPAGINCGATCSATFSSGTAVTLTASADANSTFAGWSGAGCSGTGKCVVTMDTAKSVTATFNTTPPGTYALTVSKAGLGSGTVTSSPPGISCGSSCSANFTGGTSVTLTATAASGSTFAGWSGCGSASGATCTVEMTSSRTVTATFDDTTAPAVAITSPASGSSVAGAVTISAAASDNMGIAGVQFKLDGVNLGAEITTAPYALTWDTSRATNGTHNLTVSARDASGNIGVSVAVAVTVANDFTISPSPGSPAAATISAGGTATYQLNVAGFTGSVSFTCTGVPQASTCTLSPNPANVAGQSATAVTVSVKTTSRVLANRRHSRSPFERVPLLWAFALLPGIVLLKTTSGARILLRHLIIGAACFALALCVACGGGGARSSPTPTATGTPAGTYTITVAATAGTSAHSFDLKLTVN